MLRTESWPVIGRQSTPADHPIAAGHSARADGPFRANGSAGAEGSVRADGSVGADGSVRANGFAGPEGSVGADGSAISNHAAAEGDGILGGSRQIRRLRRQIARLARSQAPVYISGETGTGKELAARAIHARSRHRSGAFVAVNCGAIPAELVESELFGHLKGSFTGAGWSRQGLFQAAHRGTLLLDEVADLPPSVQVKLLRAVQEGCVRPLGSQREVAVDVRLISATHKNLRREMEAGRLRADLYYRLNVIELAVPPLRERLGDIPELAGRILQRVAAGNGTRPRRLGKDALALLQGYGFPGNVRELENILQRAAALCDGFVIGRKDLRHLRPNHRANGGYGQNGWNGQTEVGGFSGVGGMSGEFTGHGGHRWNGQTEMGGVSAEAMAHGRHGWNGETMGHGAHEGDGKTAPMPAAVLKTRGVNFNGGFSLSRYMDDVEAEVIRQALDEFHWNRTMTARKLGTSFRSLRYRIKKHGLG